MESTPRDGLPRPSFRFFCFFFIIFFALKEERRLRRSPRTSRGTLQAPPTAARPPGTRAPTSPHSVAASVAAPQNAAAPVAHPCRPPRAIVPLPAVPRRSFPPVGSPRALQRAPRARSAAQQPPSAPGANRASRTRGAMDEPLGPPHKLIFFFFTPELFCSGGFAKRGALRKASRGFPL